MIVILAPENPSLEQYLDEMQAAGEVGCVVPDEAALLALQDVDVVISDRAAALEFEAFDGEEALTVLLADEASGGADLVLPMATRWSEISARISLLSDPLFDEQASGEIRALLGEEAYRASVSELNMGLEKLVLTEPAADLHTLISEVHKASGAYAMLGLVTLHQQLFAIESRAKGGDEAEARRLWQVFQNRWPYYRQDIETRLAAER